jgi:hypothetical protein
LEKALIEKFTMMSGSMSSNANDRFFILLRVTLALVAMTATRIEAFTSPTPSVVTPSLGRSTRTTALFISWPGKESVNEGKREESRLKLSGGAYEATSPPASKLPDFTNTETLEEIVSPVTKVLDDVTGGWALSYAPLDPETPTTPIGISFLLTNLAYGIAGGLMATQGNALLGALTEVACLASFFYHWSQLEFGQGGERGSSVVRLALLVDYFFAILAIIVGSLQLYLGHQVPFEVVLGGSMAVASLGACWVWEQGLTYIFFHSLWHLFSAYTGFVIGTTNL